MSRPRVVMRKIREVLRLTFGEELTRRRVSKAVGLPRATIFDYLKRAAAAGLVAWPLPERIDDRELEQRFGAQGRQGQPASADDTHNTQTPDECAWSRTSFNRGL